MEESEPQRMVSLNRREGKRMEEFEPQRTQRAQRGRQRKNRKEREGEGT
jgi:hypothetical protein